MNKRIISNSAHVWTIFIDLFKIRRWLISELLISKKM